MIEERVTRLEKDVAVLTQQMHELRAQQDTMKDINVSHPSLHLSRRALNVLERAGCATTRDVERYGLDKFRRIHGCGQGTLDELRKMIENLSDNV